MGLFCALVGLFLPDTQAYFDTSAFLSDALRCRIRAQFYTLCHSDEEKPHPDDVALYSFVPSAAPAKRQHQVCIPDLSVRGSLLS